MSKRRDPAYPFVPKSNAFLRPGHFFAVPLSDGRFSAGQVLSIPTEESAPHHGPDTRTVVLGLIDWVGTELPTAACVERTTVLNWGFAHVKTISEMKDGRILGWAEPDDRLLSDYLRVSHRFGGIVWLYRNGVLVRAATDDERQSLPSMGTWGFKFLSCIAERVFVDGKPIAHSPPVDLAETREWLRREREAL